MCRQRLARVLLFGCLLTVLGGGAPLVRPAAAQAVGQPFHAQAVEAASALDWTALPVPLRPFGGNDGDKDDGDKCSVVELKCDEVQQECIVPSKVVRVVPVPVVKVVTVEKKIFVPVEKVVKVFVPVEKKVFVTVEKKVFVPVPVEKVVKVFVPVPVEKKVFVPVPVPVTPVVKVVVPVPVPATPVVKVVVPVPVPVTPTPTPTPVLLMPPGDPMF
jgi:hypothetical protein